ncbi:MAG: cytoplasmic protein [Deltaproteobacteria bacterium]|nr:cytoplasmic protein [Deltaproteobacteria bacterium]
MSRPALRQRPARVISLAERSVEMLKNEILTQNPLTLLSENTGAVLSPGQAGAVLSRPGVGKTAVLVQIGIGHLVEGRNVLHVSLDQPVRKVGLWYEEVFDLLAGRKTKASRNLWLSVLPRRLIMTFQAQRFGAAMLKERITDLSEQDIFTPAVVLVDGMVVDEQAAAELAALKDLAARQGFSLWFAARIHQAQAPAAFPQPFAPVADTFEAVLLLSQEDGGIRLAPLKGPAAGDPQKTLSLNPSTMLLMTN